MRIVDVNFYNKYIVRYLFLWKCIQLLINNWSIPKLNCLHLIFTILHALHPDEIYTSNYFYLLKYFFWCEASICNFYTQYHLGTWYYSYQIKAHLQTFKCYFVLYFFFNDLLPKLGKDYEVQFLKNQFIFLIKDLNTFLDWNSSVGLFNLQHDLELKFTFGGGNKYDCNQLLKFFKWNCI